MEISSHYPYTAKAAPEPEEQAGGIVRPSLDPEAAFSGEAKAGDRIELVGSQNLVSPPQEPVDLAKAAELLGQGQDPMQLLGKGEARELYQVDRLRHILYRVSQAERA